MFFTEESITKPRKNFNLLHLENGEMCLSTVKTYLIYNLNHEEFLNFLSFEKKKTYFDLFFKGSMENCIYVLDLSFLNQRK